VADPRGSETVGDEAEQTHEPHGAFLVVGRHAVYERVKLLVPGDRCGRKELQEHEEKDGARQ
jgi:hypothetical protein